MKWQISLGKKENPLFDRHLKESAAALDLLIEEKDACIQLIPMDVTPNPRDDLVCFRLRDYMKHSESVVVWDDNPSLAEFVRRLRELDLLVSARLHGIILGLRFGLPFIGIDSDGKIERVADSIGYKDM